MTRLGGDPDCEFILGLDIRPRAAEVRCAAEFLRFDLTWPWQQLAELFRERSINVGLHLAWQFNPIHDLARHRQVDVEGSKNFFTAAEATGLQRVVYASSTTAYVNPVNPSRPPFISEDTPVSGTPRYLYSKHKAEVDRLAQQFAAEHPLMETLVLRPSIVLGPNTQNIVSKMLDWPSPGFPWHPQVRGADPPMQFISEDDIGEILFLAVKSHVTGTYNCAGEGILSFSEFLGRAGKRPLPLPAWFIYPLTALLWTLRVAPFPAGILDMVRYPWVADNTRLKTLFYYVPRQTSEHALESFLEARRARGGA